MGARDDVSDMAIGREHTKLTKHLHKTQTQNHSGTEHFFIYILVFETTKSDSKHQSYGQKTTHTHTANATAKTDTERTHLEDVSEPKEDATVLHPLIKPRLPKLLESMRRTQLPVY